jgi:hypothetical protein
MVETAAHLVDQVLPRVGYRQWVLSVPKRVRWHLREKPEAASGLLRVFLRAVETAVRRTCPDAPPGSRYGAVAFVHRFGDALNSHVHYHVLVTDGVFSDDGQGGVRFPCRRPGPGKSRQDAPVVQQKDYRCIARLIEGDLATDRFNLSIVVVDHLGATGDAGRDDEALMVARHLVLQPADEAEALRAAVLQIL